MPKQDGTINVALFPGELGRYWVESWSDPDQPHLVDIFANGGHGQCMCMAWQTQAWPCIRDGAKLGNPKATCRHIRAARNKFLFDTLREGALRFGKQEG